LDGFDDVDRRFKLLDEIHGSLPLAFLVAGSWFLVQRGSRPYVDTISIAVAREPETSKQQPATFFLSFPNRRMHLRRQLRIFQIEIVAFHGNDYIDRFGRRREVLRERYANGFGWDCSYRKRSRNVGV